MTDNKYNLIKGYTETKDVVYDTHVVEEGSVWQPYVYDLAVLYARRYGSTDIIDVGCGSGRKLAPFKEEFNITGVDYKANIEHCRGYDYGTWIDHDLEEKLLLPVAPRSIIVCADVVEHLEDPTNLMTSLRCLLNQGAVLLLSTPTRPDRSKGPPSRCHKREWSFNEFVKYSSLYLNPAWVGTTKSNSGEVSAWATTLVVSTSGIKRADFKVPEAWAR
jgi:SAM-dependent methyltransferase